MRPRSDRGLNLFLPLDPPPGRAARLARRVLGRLGPSWLASPWRRLVQTVSLVAFLWLALVAAWPYGRFAVTPPRGAPAAPVELYLWLDPLVGLSTLLAGRQWVAGAAGGLALLLVTLCWPRLFCGWLCPLGTLIDCADAVVARRVTRWRLARVGRLTHLRYALLAVVLAAAAGGVMLSGYLAAIPLVTRGLVLTAGRWGGNQPPWTGALVASAVLFAAVLLLGLLRPRCWCRHGCPTGALFSLVSRWRLVERRVDDSCVGCGACLEACPFDAITPDYTTRPDACTFCQTCGGVCPVGAIGFGVVTDAPSPPPAEVDRPDLSRRAWVASAASGLALAAAGAVSRAAEAPIRPPGALPEDDFLARCVRCGQCLQVCPGPVLRPATGEAGWLGLWTPVAGYHEAGCHPGCHACGEVCPTGAIADLPLAQKRRAVMGRAVVEVSLCLAHTGQQDCRECVDACADAGYHAIALREIQLPTGEVPPGVFSELELEAMSRIAAPFVRPGRCVGCGLCEHACHALIHVAQRLLPRSAITVSAPGRHR